MIKSTPEKAKHRNSIDFEACEGLCFTPFARSHQQCFAPPPGIYHLPKHVAPYYQQKINDLPDSGKAQVNLRPRALYNGRHLKQTILLDHFSSALLLLLVLG